MRRQGGAWDKHHTTEEACGPITCVRVEGLITVICLPYIQPQGLVEGCRHRRSYYINLVEALSRQFVVLYTNEGGGPRGVEIAPNRAVAIQLANKLDDSRPHMRGRSYTSPPSTPLHAE